MASRFPGKPISNTIMIVEEFLEGFQINKKPAGVKTCPKHKMNFSLSGTKVFFVTHTYFVNIPQIQYCHLDGIPKMLVFENKHFLKIIQNIGNSCISWLTPRKSFKTLGFWGLQKAWIPKKLLGDFLEDLLDINNKFRNRNYLENLWTLVATFMGLW